MPWFLPSRPLQAGLFLVTGALSWLLLGDSLNPVSLAQDAPAGASTVAPDSATNSLLLQTWSGPYGGVPPWDRVRPGEFVEAFDQAMSMARQDIAQIADNPAPATFENTIVALESAGRPLTRLGAVFGVYASNLNVGPMPDIQKIIMPKLAAYEDSVTQNEKLFARIATVYEDKEAQQSLSEAERRLLEDRYKSFVREGAQLNAADKARLTKINQRLATLFADFSQNVLDDEQNYVTWIL